MKPDIVVLDFDGYRPMADFEHPAELAAGVVHAFVNGQPAIQDGEPRATLGGEIIDRQALDCAVGAASAAMNTREAASIRP